MICGSRNDTVVTLSRSSGTVVDLAHQHTNHTVLVEGPEITIRPVGTRRLVAGASMNSINDHHWVDATVALRHASRLSGPTAVAEQLG